ncbi:MAG: nucleotidyl transferase AbiEii/AbiGii toxin family protein [Candidatus Paceibacterota bacterium]
MIIPDKKDALHKSWLYRVLQAIADNPNLARVLYFKGGTCAAMLDWLPRFSVDLDFDYGGGLDQAEISQTRLHLQGVFDGLGLSVKDWSKNGIQYFLKYPSSGTDKDGEGGPTSRNTLKIDASFPLFKSSKYEPMRFTEIDRILTCQTKETMFAHKLVTPLDRFEKTGAIAGRDLFDIHHFFLSGFAYDAAVIQERRNTGVKEYLTELSHFVENRVTDTVITEDLSSLLPFAEFTRIRKVLKREVLSLLQDEISRQ